jgi:undecaprenyl-diphosphatase
VTERVALIRGARLAWARSLGGWRDAPPCARRRWARTLGAGLGGALLLSVLLTLAAMRLAETGALDGERAWLAGLERRAPLSFHSALWLEGLGSSAMLMPLVGAAAALAALTGRSFRAVLVLVSYAAAKLLILCGWLLWDRARPDFIEGGVAVPASLHSFPSGHTLQTVAVYGVLTWFWVRASRSRVEQAAAWLLFAALAAVVALARLRLGTHWPSDVAAGAVLGGVWLGVLIVAQRGLEDALSRGARRRPGRPDPAAAPRRAGSAPPTARGRSAAPPSP